MLREREWKVDSVLRLLMGICLGFAAVGFLSTLLGDRLAAMWPASVSQPKRFTAFLFGVLSFHGVAIPALVYFLWENGRKWGEAFDIPGARPWRALGLGIVCAPPLILVAYGLEHIVGWLLERAGYAAKLQDTVEMIQSEHAWFVQGAFFLFAVVLAPVIEECLFRGVFFTVLRDAGFRRLGLVVSGVVFGAIHLNLTAFLPLTVFGLVQALLYERSGSLLTPIVVHCLFNLVPFLLLWSGVSMGN